MFDGILSTLLYQHLIDHSCLCFFLEKQLLCFFVRLRKRYLKIDFFFSVCMVTFAIKIYKPAWIGHLTPMWFRAIQGVFGFSFFNLFIYLTLVKSDIQH